MASPTPSEQVVLEALHSLPTRIELQIDSSRTAKFCTEVEKSVSSSDNHDTFVAFSENLLVLLRGPICMDTPASVPKRRERMWTQYAKLRAKDLLPNLWKTFLTNIQCGHVTSEPLCMDIVNEILFEKLIEEMFRVEPEESTEADADEAALLTKDEENIL